MLISQTEHDLCHALRELPSRFSYRYTADASRTLLQLLFRSITGLDDVYTRYLFPDGPPGEEVVWKLRDSQGAVNGAEYTEAARGHPCGHIFKAGEPTYRCKTCTADDTCVLCAKCFEASNHDDHQVFVSISPGNSGCCDCGDEEAWVRPVHCNIHSVLAKGDEEMRDSGKARAGSDLPEALRNNVQVTIARTLDYICDVFSCSPEQLRLPKTEEGVIADEKNSRLASRYYGEEQASEEEQPEFALVLWNDEKHTVHDVRDQIARACKQRRSYGLEKAYEVDEVGRSVVIFSSNVQELLHMAKIIEEIKLTVTIRSARDTFREQMCATMIEWIHDIAGCMVGDDAHLLRNTICEELLKPWRPGSQAHHGSVGVDGIDDHEIEEAEQDGPEVMLRRALRMRAARRPRVTTEVTETPGGFAVEIEEAQFDDAEIDEEDDEDEEIVWEEGREDGGSDMDIDQFAEDRDGDVDMDASDEPEDVLEVSEATYAGYPPPPPPPPAPARREHDHTPADSDGEPVVIGPGSAALAERPLDVPKTPKLTARSARPPRPPKHWLEKPDGYRRDNVPVQEDLWSRVRLDHFILYDLRMWKKVRIDVRDVLISTVVTIPHFKRWLSLRFAGLYPTLAQLYLIADREPDHSIINLSLQMLTTPSITAEIIERGNFFTNLIAILYTFLTTRQVGYPAEVNPTATLAFEAGAVTNRRLGHFYLDLKYLLGSELVHERLRNEPRYLTQFLDLVKLHQGICPNVRAVGEHIEYETDAWISASIITREINKLCRQFAEAFTWTGDQDSAFITRAIRTTAKQVIINSIGAERKRFDQAEIKHEVKFHRLEMFEFEAENAQVSRIEVVHFDIAKEPMSFHHALHYTISWLIDRGKSMSPEELMGLLLFSHAELKQPPVPAKAQIGDFQPDQYMLAMFDFPIRVCAWLAQMKAGMWVRNGITLRHQMSQYRSVGQRDWAYQRDVFLIQVALCVCDPSTVLATMVNRFGMLDWIKGNYQVRPGFEISQVLDVAEEFVYLLIILLTDRTSLYPVQAEKQAHLLAIKRDLAHVLCFKPLSFSEICGRINDKTVDSDEFQTLVEEMTTYRAPEGLSDTGTFALKEDHLEDIDPYLAQYSRNQREDAEKLYKEHMAKKTGKAAADIVFEPKLRPIESGVFRGLSAFTNTRVFSQIIYYLLGYALISENQRDGIQTTRVEAFLQFVLQLVLVAVLDDDSSEAGGWNEQSSFITNVLQKRSTSGRFPYPTTLSALHAISEMEDFKACEPKIRTILHRMQQKRPASFAAAVVASNLPQDRMETSSPAPLAVSDKELKKKQALERQARVMAQFKEQQTNFLANQAGDLDEEDFSDLEDEEMGQEKEKFMKYPAGTCILCQEETSDQRLYGTFAFISDSTIFRPTPANEADWRQEILDTPASLDRSAEHLRPFGVAGSNKQKITKVTPQGQTTTTERQGLGKGFPGICQTQGPTSTGCGHIMHYACFEVYMTATQRRHLNQIARNHPERPGPDSKEFLCPLCKALGNAFLPIIWKGKSITHPGVLQPAMSFGEMIRRHTQYSQLEIQLQQSAATESQRERFREYGQREIITPLASRLSDLPRSSILSIIPNTLGAYATNLLHGGNPASDGVSAPTANAAESSSQGALSSTPVLELMRIYQRLRDSMKSAKLIPTRFHYASAPRTVEDLTHTDTLVSTLGYSIAATEIAQRGVPSEPGTTLLDSISSQNLMHLRVLSETALSYLAVGTLRSQSASITSQEVSSLQRSQYKVLFAPEARIPEERLGPGKMGTSLLAHDPFITLSEASTCLVPAMELDIQNIVRLCYIAELVRVTLEYTIGAVSDVGTNLERADNAACYASTIIDPSDVDATRNFRSFVCFVSDSFMESMQSDNPYGEAEAEACLAWAANRSRVLPFDPEDGRSESRRVDVYLQKMLITYATTFLRKVTILMHVRYGVDFQRENDLSSFDEPELVRLTRALNLPTLPEIFRSIVSEPYSSVPANDMGASLRPLIQAWIAQWRRGFPSVAHMDQHYLSGNGHAKLPFFGGTTPFLLSHPAIFELVGLPKNYDTLTDEAIHRRCPTTGKEVTDPALCLFCGDIFCSQAVCCMKDKNKGGCWQHMQTCGVSTGLFINIRKCMVLFLHADNGTWTPAPYLDKHGEADPTLRRHHQLFLNQKRYDRLLRDVWLGGGIQSVIARKMEGDVNNGGWETL